jgi:hypothetical protein
MADVLKRLLGPVNVANGSTTIFTGVAAHIYTIRNITIVNPTAGTITVKLGVNGITDASLILPSTPLGPGESAQFDGMLVLTGAETIQANASATGLTITISGLDQG